MIGEIMEKIRDTLIDLTDTTLYELKNRISVGEVKTPENQVSPTPYLCISPENVMIDQSILGQLEPSDYTGNIVITYFDDKVQDISPAIEGDNYISFLKKCDTIIKVILSEEIQKAYDNFQRLSVNYYYDEENDLWVCQMTLELFKTE